MCGYLLKHCAGWLLCRFKSWPFPLIKSFQRFSHPPLLGTEGETSLNTESFLINVNDFYEKETSGFSWLLLCLLLLKNNQLKIIFMPKRCVLRWRILLPFSSKEIDLPKSKGSRNRYGALWSQLAGSACVWLQIHLPPGYHSGLVLVHSSLLTRWVTSVCSVWLGL